MNFSSACSEKMEMNGGERECVYGPNPILLQLTTSQCRYSAESLKIHSYSKEGTLEGAWPFNSDFLVT